jgi:hypothetical protein
MGGIRSALIYRVRKSSLQIYGVELAEEILRRRATSLILRRSLGGVTQDGAISYSSFPPCLYPEDATQANLKNKEWRREHLFRNAGLMRVSFQASLRWRLLHLLIAVSFRLAGLLFRVPVLLTQSQKERTGVLCTARSWASSA